MKRFLKLIFLLIMASFVLSLSGCGGHNSSLYERLRSENNNNSDSSTNNNDSSTNNNNSDTNNNSNSNSNTNNTVDSGGNSATITKDSNGVVNIVLSNSESVNAAADGTLGIQEYVWNISPERGEYWTAPDGTILDDEDDVLNAIEMIEGVYIARDIRYVPNTLNFSETKVAKELGGQDSCYVAYYSQSLAGDSNHILAALPTEYNGQQNASLETVKAAMTHSASDAAKYPVLHITKPGQYSLSGQWQGQIWVDIPDESVNSGIDTEDDDSAQVVLILNGLTVNCGVAPALVFKNVYECGPDDSSTVASRMASEAYAIGEEVSDSAGAVVLLAAGTTNTFTGTNVARMNKLKLNDDDYTENQIGQYVKAQKKLYKLDAAFHSRQSLLINNDDSTDGTLTINSDYEGLDSELHMMIENGNITVTANDDGINVNEDNISVFTMTGGTLTVTSNYGDGIDSNGYASFKNCTLNITAGNQRQNSAGEAGIDAEKTVTIDESSVTYTWNASGNNNGGGFGGGGTPPSDGNGPGGNPPSGRPSFN